ncbi:hypothetical protein [Streptomyces soliscabiei]|uniref:hypothetical protein n=1 Tax=Streptomyces soliscabiei TaxID=588897 RepID=UPI0029AF9C09|nr:hypothetical protein [Streptomyces sp. NY05-11A]MDX2679264.1 hypothetical protein [Streptomyces sp. NY05-11A]
MLTADHTRIIDRLDEGHAAMNAAGLGSPALDDFHKLQVQIITESSDPQATIRAMADLMAEGRARTTGAAS